MRRGAALTIAAVLAVLATACRGSGAPSSASSRAAAPASSSGLADCLTASRCYAPHQYRVAYGIQSLLDRGIDGRGQTVVLPEFAAVGTAKQPLGEPVVWKTTNAGAVWFSSEYRSFPEAPRFLKGFSFVNRFSPPL